MRYNNKQVLGYRILAFVQRIGLIGLALIGIVACSAPPPTPTPTATPTPIPASATRRATFTRIPTRDPNISPTPPPSRTPEPTRTLRPGFTPPTPISIPTITPFVPVFSTEDPSQLLLTPLPGTIRPTFTPTFDASKPPPVIGQVYPECANFAIDSTKTPRFARINSATPLTWRPLTLPKSFSATARITYRVWVKHPDGRYVFSAEVLGTTIQLPGRVFNSAGVYGASVIIFIDNETVCQQEVAVISVNP
jgi:hypothetical protein